MADRIKLRCQACGEAENCNIFCELTMAEQIIDQLKADSEMHRWISVSEEMPSQVSGHWGSEIVFATDGKQAWAC